jgi:hypothetical protein
MSRIRHELRNDAGNDVVVNARTDTFDGDIGSTAIDGDQIHCRDKASGDDVIGPASITSDRKLRWSVRSRRIQRGHHSPCPKIAFLARRDTGPTSNRRNSRKPYAEYCSIQVAHSCATTIDIYKITLFIDVNGDDKQANEQVVQGTKYL